MLPPVNPPRHLSEAISTKLGPFTSLHSRSVQAGAMLTSTRQIPAAIANFAPDSDGFLWIKSNQSRTTACQDLAAEEVLIVKGPASCRREA